MQRIALLSLVVLLCAFSARAQQFPASIPPGEARMCGCVFDPTSSMPYLAAVA